MLIGKIFNAYAAKGFNKLASKFVRSSYGRQWLKGISNPEYQEFRKFNDMMRFTGYYHC